MKKGFPTKLFITAIFCGLFGAFVLPHWMSEFRATPAAVLTQLVVD